MINYFFKNSTSSMFVANDVLCIISSFFIACSLTPKWLQLHQSLLFKNNTRIFSAKNRQILGWTLSAEKWEYSCLGLKSTILLKIKSVIQFALILSNKRERNEKTKYVSVRILRPVPANLRLEHKKGELNFPLHSWTRKCRKFTDYSTRNLNRWQSWRDISINALLLYCKN